MGTRVSFWRILHPANTFKRFVHVISEILATGVSYNWDFALGVLDGGFYCNSGKLTCAPHCSLLLPSLLYILGRVEIPRK